MKVTEKDLDIDNSSMYALEKDIITYSRKLNEFGKMLAQATRELGEAELELEVVSSELVTRVRKEQKIPPSVIQEVRRSMITSYEEYKVAKLNVIEKAEQMNIARSAYYSMTYKNDRIKEAFRLELKKLQPDSTFTVGETYVEKNMSYEESVNKKLKEIKLDVD